MSWLQKLAFWVVAISLFPALGQAQCPSIANSGQPAVMFVTLFGQPNVNYITPVQEEYKPGVLVGFNIGSMFSRNFHLQSGVEFSWVKRSISDSVIPDSSLDYRTLFMEIPLEMRIMLFASMDKKSHGYLTFGPSLVVYNMRESNDPVETIDETFYHQMFVRLGFEQSITVASKFNFLWGILAKADPIALAGGDQSKLNGTYFGGLKLGLQFGL